MKDWQHFVLEHGFKAHTYELAAILARPVADIERVRRTSACTRLKKGKRFAEIFALWHGRPPKDNEWPAPRFRPKQRTYEWQAPDLAFLASLVGRLGKREIADILTKRLRERTGDRCARRSLESIQMCINYKLGMETRDVVGGITTREAGRDIGSRAVVFNAIREKKLKAFRVGIMWVIPRAEWDRWKASRRVPPAGYVQLAAIRQSLGIRSDSKLPEFAKLGYIPTAVLCDPVIGSRARSSVRGTWYVDSKVAAKLVVDRRAGRPMPWHGKPMPDNLRATFKLLQTRRHPPACTTCAHIWGRKGPPRTYDDYALRYPPLAHGAKRHLTRTWTPGLTVAEVARRCRRSHEYVRRAIDNGMLDASGGGRHRYISRTEATRWKAGRCPSGSNDRSWLSIGVARKQYLFTLRQLRAFINEGRLRSKVGTNGPMRDVTYVPRRQLARLRERIGCTEGEAARRSGVSMARIRLLLKDLDWRGARGIPLVTVQAVIKRLQSERGHTIEEAAAEIGTTVEWVRERILEGTIRVMRAKWDRRRLYITGPMLDRLKRFKRNPVKLERFNSDWLLLSQASNEAGVSPTIIQVWAQKRDLGRRPSRLGMRYHRRAVRARSRRYWETCRLKRAIPPQWLQLERVMKGASV